MSGWNKEGIEERLTEGRRGDTERLRACMMYSSSRRLGLIIVVYWRAPGETMC